MADSGIMTIEKSSDVAGHWFLACTPIASCEARYGGNAGTGGKSRAKG